MKTYISLLLISLVSLTVQATNEKNSDITSTIYQEPITKQNKRIKKLPTSPIILKKTNYYVGLNLGIGSGFTTQSLFVDNNQQNVRLSTGGGFSIGIIGGCEINRHFDLSISGLYALSIPASRKEMNDNKQSKGDASFERATLLITPTWIIPLNSNNDVMRFKLGVGIGLYSLGTMNIRENDDISYIYNYKTSLGAHSTFCFEYNLPKNISYQLGVRYYYVNYPYTTSGSSKIPTDNNFNNINGSGIDFILGLMYRFR